ncbi:hypothetical protein [Desulfocastanea catecholica]
MKVIGSIGEVLSLPGDLGMFILESCPWMAEEWEPEIIGYVFVLEDRDINEVSSICTVPHIEENDYREAMSIDLATFDLWETPSFFDDTTGYWNVVAILGEEYGCAVFLSSGFVASIPPLQDRLKAINHSS